MIAEMLRTQELVVPHTTTVEDEVRKLLQIIAYALHATTNTVTKQAAADQVFGRDIIVHQKSLVD